MSKRCRAQIVFYALNITIPLLFGLLIYLSFRKDAYVSILAGNLIRLPDVQHSTCPGWINAFLRNYVSDMLWAYSLTFAVSCAIDYSRIKLNYVFVICVIFETITEIAQKVGLLHGTFDILDIILEAFSICIALLIIKKFEEAHDEKSNANPNSASCLIIF